MDDMNNMDGKANTFKSMQPMMKESQEGCPNCGHKFEIRAPKETQVSKLATEKAPRFGKLKKTLNFSDK